MEAEDIEVGGWYKNKKTGNLYVVIQIVTHSESLEPLVIYHRQITEKDRWWARPLKSFAEKFEHFRSID